jgi:hypothetical protein
VVQINPLQAAMWINLGAFAGAVTTPLDEN